MQKRDEHGASFQSSSKINRMLITRLNLHAMKIYNTGPVSLTFGVFVINWILLFSTTEIFICYKAINDFKRYIEFVDEPVPEKLDIFRINIYSAFLAKHAWRSNMLSVACFHGLRKEDLGLYGLPFWRTHTKKKKEKKCLHVLESRCS